MRHKYLMMEFTQEEADRARQWAFVAADAAESKKGEDIVVLDMRRVTLVADYFVIVSGRNVIQVQTIADAIEEAMDRSGVSLLNRAGRDRSHWVLLDYGSLVVHIFTDQERAYYDLERLWGDADWVARPAGKGTVSRRSPVLDYASSEGSGTPDGP